VLYPTLDRLGITRNPRAAGFHTFRHSAATIQRTGQEWLTDSSRIAHDCRSEMAEGSTQITDLGQAGFEPAVAPGKRNLLW
jgi:hypothetical protein